MLDVLARSFILHLGAYIICIMEAQSARRVTPQAVDNRRSFVRVTVRAQRIGISQWRRISDHKDMSERRRRSGRGSGRLQYLGFWDEKENSERWA